METTDGTSDGTTEAPAEAESETRPEICAYSTTQERTVFTESGNGDGWIATDLIVEPDQ